MTAPKLTAREASVLDAIGTYVTCCGYPPTVREIGALVGLASSSSVTHQLRNLVNKGRLRCDFNSPRAIAIVGASFHLPAPA